MYAAGPNLQNEPVVALVAHRDPFPGTTKNRHFDVLSKECQEHRERLRGVVQGLADQVRGASTIGLVGEPSTFCAYLFPFAYVLEPVCVCDEWMFFGLFMRNETFRVEKTPENLKSVTTFAHRGGAARSIC